MKLTFMSEVCPAVCARYFKMMKSEEHKALVRKIRFYRTNKKIFGFTKKETLHIVQDRYLSDCKCSVIRCKPLVNELLEHLESSSCILQIT